MRVLPLLSIPLAIAFAFGVEWRFESFAGKLHFGGGLTDRFVNSLLWLPLTPLVAWLAGRFHSENWLRFVKHALAAFVLSVAVWALRDRAGTHMGEPAAREIPLAAGASVLVRRPDSPPAPASPWTLTLHGMAIYGAVLAGWTFQRHRDRVRTLQEQVSSAKLLALRMQIRPHFLFNTLNSIAALTRKDPGKAEDMLVDLSTLLRSTLDRGGDAEIPLHEEVDILRTYLEIEQRRFPGRLEFAIDVDAGAADAPVPTFLLQPIVENAIKHGIERSRLGGKVTVGARMQDHWLAIRIENDGPPMEPAWSPGIGLGNTIQRLEQAYRGRASLTLEPRAQGGAVVQLNLPA